MITLEKDNQVMRLEDFSLRPLRAHDRPRSGKITHKSQHIPGVSGDWYFGSEIGTKVYGLQANALQDNFEKFNDLMDNLMAFLLDAEGKPALIKAQFDDTNKRFAYLRLNSPIVPNVKSILEKVPLEFVAYDPHEYAESTVYDPAKPLKYDVGNPYGTKSYPNTQSFRWIYSRHYSGLENYSSLNTDIKITIKGTVKGGSVKHLGSGVSIAVPDISNGTVVIDTEMFNLQLNGRDTIIDGDFFKLAPGDNGFLFEAETANATMSFEWYHKFS